MSSVTGGPKHELQGRCPSGALTAMETINRACTGRRGSRCEELRPREGRAKGCMRRLRHMDTDEDERPARSRWETSVCCGCALEPSRRCGPASTRQELFAPAHRLGKSVLGINSSASREHGGDPGGLRCWPWRSLLDPSTGFAGSNGWRASDERRHRDVLGRPPG
jgi:hypothetical protein